MRKTRYLLIDIMISILYYLIFLFLFSCHPTLPRNKIQPYLISPLDREKSVSLLPTFYWNHQLTTPIDIQYDFYLYKYNKIDNHQNLLPYKENLNENIFMIDEPLEQNCIYCWFVVARGNYNGFSFSYKSKTITFTTGTAIIPAPRYFLITVGVGNYLKGDPPYISSYKDLSGAPNDAKAMKRVFSKLNEPYKIYSHIGTVSRSDVESSINEIANIATKDDFVVFHFSGHGNVYQENSYLVFSDYEQGLSGKKEYESEKNLNALTLRRLLDTIAGKKLVIIDACNAGSFSSMTLTATDFTDDENLFSQFFISSFIQEDTDLLSCKVENQYNNYHIITSTSNKEMAFEVKNGYGFCIISLLDGLGYNSESDFFDYSFNADLKAPYFLITFDELVRFIQSGVKKLANSYGAKRQTICFYPDNSLLPITSYFGSL